MSPEQRDSLRDKHRVLFNRREKEYLTEQELKELDALRVAVARLDYIKGKEQNANSNHTH